MIRQLRFGAGVLFLLLPLDYEAVSLLAVRGVLQVALLVSGITPEEFLNVLVSSRQQSTNSGDRDSSARSLASDRPDNVIQTTSILQSTDRITTEHRQNHERIISDY